jgi:hypothetical protein
LHTHASAYRATKALSGQQDRVLRAIEDCRSARLGGHIEVCDACGTVTPRYHSCGNRHCPKCQTLAKERWIAARNAELLPIEYFHIVFTLPHELNPLAQGNPRLIYDLLFQAAAQTLQAFGRDPKWLGGELGFTMVLHTWGQNLGQHIHVHCVVTGGALSPDGERWIPSKKGFLFPVRALSRVFRGSISISCYEPMNAVRCASPDQSPTWPHRAPSARFRPRSELTNGWCTPNGPSPDPSRWWPIVSAPQSPFCS